MKVDIPDDMLEELNYWFKKNYALDFTPNEIGELIENYIYLNKRIDVIEKAVKKIDFGKED